MIARRAQDSGARLAPLVAVAQRRAAQLHETTHVGALLESAARFRRRSLLHALRGNPPAIMAEVKKASPSQGLFRKDFDPVRLARSYTEGQAAAISVVTEPAFFQGDPAWIAAIRDASDLPVLRKDFIVDPIQIAESAACGADAVLLIARILTPALLRELAGAAADAGLDVLFEAHDEEDLRAIAPLAPTLVGINARNLDDFTVDPRVFTRLRDGIPATAVAVAESGIDQHSQIHELLQVGYHAFLIGGSLITSEDPAATLRALRGDAHA